MQNKVDHILSISMLHSTHLSSLLIRRQGIPDYRPRFPMSRNYRFRFGTKSGYSEVIDQRHFFDFWFLYPGITFMPGLFASSKI